ncbi:hypothetical protein SGGMMB4_03090 [Sodalis glossinidius str. 'morsitans']|nr:hypothetical protein [Sodalis glossinidius]CRL45406.1 hypothetical protein SGGMMB4_03090 [Sodalis glossinidius str. 'morsitans']
MLSAICANSSITPTIRPLPSRTTLNPLAGSIASVRNRAVGFDSKPSYWSSVKRTLVSLLRKVVRVCQAIPEALATLASCWGRTKNSPSKPDMARTRLMTKKLQTAGILRIGWAEVNHDNPERLCDQIARRNFNRTVLTAELEGQSFNACTRMLAHLEGGIQHLRGVLDFAAEQVGQTEDDPVKISTAYKYPTFVEDIIIALHERLGRYDVLVDSGDYIYRYSEIIYKYINALSSVGIGADLLKANA